jgi:ABC-type glycerol-3-phosphate transport system permease component
LNRQREGAPIVATTIVAVLQPVLMVVLMQRWFVKGLVERKK